MRKLLFVLVFICFLAGCSSTNSGVKEMPTQPQSTETSPQTTPAPGEKAVESEEPKSSPEKGNETGEDTGWFAGVINDTLKIHMKLDVKENKVSGVYYYDKYKTSIALKGDVQNEVLSLSEEGSKGSMEVMFISDRLIEGYWTDKKNTYPLYAIREGSNIPIPEKPGSTLMQWKGDWKGVNSEYYGGSDLTVTPLFNNLIKFDLFAFNGTHTGALSSLAKLNKGTAVFLGDDDIVFKFTLDGKGDINLDATDYGYYCGMGVQFDSVYTKKPLDIHAPTAKEAGLVYTDEQERIFKELTGEHYDTFIQYAQMCAEGEDADGLGAEVRFIGVRGYMNAGVVMVRQKDNTIWAAVDGGDAVYYFTNDKGSVEPPKTIMKWYEPKSGTKMVKIIK